MVYFVKGNCLPFIRLHKDLARGVFIFVRNLSSYISYISFVTSMADLSSDSSSSFSKVFFLVFLFRVGVEGFSYANLEMPYHDRGVHSSLY